MGLYKIFSCNMEIQYKSNLISKAMIFTVATTLLTLILPFIIAYRSRGFWMKSHTFYEQPTIQFTYDYLILVEMDDPSEPIVCSNFNSLNTDTNKVNCLYLKVQDIDINSDNKNDILHFKFVIHTPIYKNVTSVIMLLGLDFHLQTTCPLQMQSLAVINKDFYSTISGMTYYGDIEFYQTTHLPCTKYVIDTAYNTSLFNNINDNDNILDTVLQQYYSRKVTTPIKPLHTRNYKGEPDTLTLKIQLRVPELLIRYIPSILQELKWAWPQYLSLVVIFNWFFNKIKCCVFNNRLVSVWKMDPWKHKNLKQ